MTCNIRAMCLLRQSVQTLCTCVLDESETGYFPHNKRHLLSTCWTCVRVFFLDVLWDNEAPTQHVSFVELARSEWHGAAFAMLVFSVDDFQGKLSTVSFETHRKKDSVLEKNMGLCCNTGERSWEVHQVTTRRGDLVIQVQLHDARWAPQKLRQECEYV